ncbi:MAG: protocatechuate 3,4-dioxygenase subunit alpha [Acidimicrobiales bacterium]
MSTSPTPSQTVGPYFEIGFQWCSQPELVPESHPDAIGIEGLVFDGEGTPVPDAVLEIFQADGTGRFPPDTAPSWSGFGRCLSDEAGRYRFVTVKPGADERGVAPHIDVSVFARGLLQRLITRCYFADEAANEHDPLLNEIGPELAATIVAEHRDGSYRFDVHLQGDRETAFFAW